MITKKIKIVLVLIVVFISVIPLQAQNSKDVGAWYMYFGNFKLNEKWSFHNELQVWERKPTKDFQQLILRTGLNYKINKNNIVTGGYAYFKVRFPASNSIENTLFSREHRLWEQLVQKQQLGIIQFNHRFRLEQRFIKKEESDKKYQNRFRYRILLKVPLSNKKLVDKTFYLVWFDEVFLRFDEATYGQNWIYTALGYKFNKKISVQAGYQVINNPSVRVTKRLQFSLHYNLDFSKG